MSTISQGKTFPIRQQNVWNAFTHKHIHRYSQYNKCKVCQIELSSGADLKKTHTKLQHWHLTSFDYLHIAFHFSISIAISKIVNVCAWNLKCIRLVGILGVLISPTCMLVSFPTLTEPKNGLCLYRLIVHIHTSSASHAECPFAAEWPEWPNVSLEIFSTHFSPFEQCWASCGHKDKPLQMMQKG